MLSPEQFKRLQMMEQIFQGRKGMEIAKSMVPKVKSQVVSRLKQQMLDAEFIDAMLGTIEDAIRNRL